MKLTVAPLTPDCWPDLEAAFTAKGCSTAMPIGVGIPGRTSVIPLPSRSAWRIVPVGPMGTRGDVIGPKQSGRSVDGNAVRGKRWREILSPAAVQ
jgi:hypothetical protein